MCNFGLQYKYCFNYKTIIFHKMFLRLLYETIKLTGSSYLQLMLLSPPPLPIQAMLDVRRATIEQKFLFVTRNIALYRRGEAQIYFYFGIRSLIIFMKAAGFGFYALFLHHFVLSSTLLQRRPSATVFVSVFYLTVCSLMPVVCWWCLMPGRLKRFWICL